MKLLLDFAVLLVMAIPLGVAAAWMVQRGPDAMRGFFRGTQLGWPRGVQEEDLDHRWGSSPGTSPGDGAGSASTSTVTAVRVHPVIKPRR